MKKNKLKVFPIFKHIFSQNSPSSITKNNLLLKRVISEYPKNLEKLSKKNLKIEISEILLLVIKKWKKDSNKDIIFKLLFLEFCFLLKNEENKNSLFFIKKFLEMIKNDFEQISEKLRKKIFGSLKIIFKIFLNFIKDLGEEEKIVKKFSIEKIIIQKKFQNSKNGKISKNSKNVKNLKNEEISKNENLKISKNSKNSKFLINSKKIPKLDLGLTKGPFSNLLASRSTRRAQVSFTLRKNENSEKIPQSQKNLNSIANSLGKSFISGEVVWFLRFFREKFLENLKNENFQNFDIFEKNLKKKISEKKNFEKNFFSENSKKNFYTSILGEIKLKNDFVIDKTIFENNLYTETNNINKNDFLSQENIKKKNSLKKNYSNIYEKN